MGKSQAVSQPAEAPAQRAAREAAALENELAAAVERTAFLESQLAELRDEMAALESQAQEQAAAVEEFAAVQDFPMEPPMPSFEERESVEPRGDGGDEDGERGRRNWEMDEESRQAFIQRFRDRVDGFFTERITTAQNAAQQERLSLIHDYVAAQMELRGQMRGATEEEREAIRQTMGENMEGLAKLLEEERQFLMESTASKYGVDEEAFANAVRALQNEPMFQAGRLMGGMMGGWGGRGPGRGAGGRR
jgi:hypothetical protein